MKVKICGITNTDDALFVAQQGVDFIGFIFYPPSARYIDPAHAATIVRLVRKEMGGQSPRFVGVFVDEPVLVVNRIRDQAGLDLIQLHGDETPNDVRKLLPGVFKAIKPASLSEAQADTWRYTFDIQDVDQVPQLLVDAYHPIEKGGTGCLGDLNIAAWCARRYRVLLAGGLNPNNVTAVIHTVQPWGVDVSSGVEIAREGILVKGQKDPEKVRSFMDAIRNVTLP